MSFSGEQALKLLDGLADGLLVQSVPTGGVVHVNGGFLDLLLCDRNRLNGQPDSWIDHIYPDDQASVRRWWQQLLTRPGSAEQAYRLVKPGNNLRWIHCRSLLVEASLGQATCLATLHHDVTSHRQPSPSVDWQWETLQTIFGSFLIGISCCDRNGRIIWANEAFASLLDYEPGDLSQRYLKDLMMPAAGWQLGANGEDFVRPWSCELEWITGLYQQRWMLTTMAPLGLDVAQAAACICMVQDISHYKQTEVELRTTLAETEVLIAEIHHRVKNNLQIISSLLELQANRTQDAHTRSILFGSQDRVLAMSLIHETLYQSDHMTCINFASYVRHLVSGLSRAYAAEQTVDFNLNCEANATISTNLAVPLGLILNELITNALKHRLAGCPRDTLTVSFCPISNDDFELSVTQSSGYLPEDFSIHQPTSMGLQIVKVLTQKIGAQLTIQQPPVTFKVAFSVRQNLGHNAKP
jgi:two-component sensor histidine kinase/PAS domain-containing protein